MEQITPQHAAERLAGGWTPFVLDVRTQDESAAASLDFTDILCPHDALHRVKDLIPKDREILVYCARGGRSTYACQWLEALGFTGLYNLDGGIRGWADQVDPSLKPK